MNQKFKLLYQQITSLVLANPEIAAGVGILLLILLFKRTKAFVFITGLGLLALVVWFWFTSSFEKRNENQKFQRYKESRTQGAEATFNDEEAAPVADQVPPPAAVEPEASQAPTP